MVEKRKTSVRKTSLETPTPSRRELRRGSTMGGISSPSKRSPKKAAPPVTVEELEHREEVVNMINILEGDSCEAAQKRQILKLFDWFKAQYSVLSAALRDSLFREQQLILKPKVHGCIVVKLQTKLHMNDTEAEGLAFFKEECERSWHSIHVSHQREQEALEIISDLRSKIARLEEQVKELQRRPLEPRRMSFTQSASLSQLRPKTMEPDPITTFNDWKSVNRVWSPPKMQDRSTSLYWGNYSSSPAASSTPTLATPMERAMTAAGSIKKRPEWRSHLPQV
ncbi:hypothetical protein ACHHYP_00553 [Achlya hypogyna]|uniref:Uncharacterized protein n=1 Tax=Achlya hypogyna TaxID=1202772 RepID=A0A1V9ZUA3_ACHHY|nr:hypothetical protein ACHHYP_00553 [Achlya hypogyna]